uniref:Uncharacterized protein n=1 Tax=Romanomermis culicivorax TaxID=13658 RepID=A0A915IXE4_ROMCU
MTRKFWFILFAIFPSTAANEKDYVCNNGTQFECLCYKGDGQLAKQYPDCHAFLGEQTLLIMQISLKFDTVKNGMVDRRKYERIFKRYIIANLITKYCLRQGHQKSKHCRHLDLPVPVENVVILKIFCAEGHVSVVDMAMVEKSDQKLLTNVNTVSPAFLIKVVNASLRRRSLKHVKLIDTGTTYFAIPRSPLFVHRNSGESQDHHVQNTPFYISLVVLILAIIFICTFTALKVSRDRARAKTKANDKAYAEKCHNYGSTKYEQPILRTEPTFQYKVGYSTPETKNVFGNELQTTAIVAVQQNPSNSIPSATFEVNYPQIQVDDHEEDDKDYQKAKIKRTQSLATFRQYMKSVKMTSKAGILFRKIVSDYVLSKRRIRPDKENVDEGSPSTFSKPTFYGSVETSVHEFGGSHRIKPNHKCGKSKSDNTLLRYTESYPKVHASTTTDILSGVKSVDRIEEEPIELYDMKNIKPDEILSIFQVTCDVPKISITTTDQDYAYLDNYELLNQIQTTSILGDETFNKPNIEENLNASDTSSCRETDTEGEDESETDNQGWDYAHTTLALSSSNYQQLCESQTSMNRMES